MKKTAPSPLKGRRIVIGVTGCIAAYKACDLVSRLRQECAEVRVVMTREACSFVAPLTLQVLSGNPVVKDMFEAPQEWDPAHVGLADWAEVIAVVPATANIIGKIACGIADDMLSCTVMASTSPVLIAPAMNENMYRNPAVQENIRKLARRGCHFVGPARGRLACGVEGIGRLVPTDELLGAIVKLLRA